MKTILAKFDQNGICEAVYTFNHRVSTNLYPGTELINDKKLANEIKPEFYKKTNGKISRLNKNEIAEIITNKYKNL